jgi:hypothetical protein
MHVGHDVSFPREQNDLGPSSLPGYNGRLFSTRTDFFVRDHEVARAGVVRGR